MRNILLLLLVSFYAINPNFAQCKMNSPLAKKIHSQNKNDLQEMEVLIKGNAKAVERLIISVSGKYKYSSGDISAATLSIQQIAAIITDKAIQRMEAFPPKIHLLSDSILLNSNVINVHNGAAPLTQGYDGSGVVIGFIDSGIDITHPDFKDNLGKTRIKFLWDQTKATAANTPLAPFDYGQEWNNLQIDAGLANAHKDSTLHGHGTHTAGIAVGNGLATGMYKGVAPKADIIVVALDFDGSSPFIPSYPIADATDYIFSKAFAMGKPCVINASLGTSLGSHDGKDLEAQLISNLIDQRAGQVFVAAAGNSGNSEYHLGYNVTADTNFTMFSYNAGNGSIYIQMYADTNDLKNVHFAIGADQISPSYSFRGRTAFTDISDHIGIFDEDTLFNNGNRIGIIQRYGDSSSGTYSMEFTIIPDSIDYNWRLITTGSGKFDVWNFDLIGFPLPAKSVMKDSIYYKLPDINKTIESGFQCLDNVITVGNYTNRQGYKQYNGSNYFNAAIPGKRAGSSGVGPTRDGRIKPDITSPGDITIAAVESTWKAGLILANNTSTMAFGGYHIRSNGTSNSSPGVAGIAALYLQKNPTATSTQVKSAITSCAKQDQYTGSSLPNNYWGYGKANAFGALTNCAASISENNGVFPARLLVYPNPSVKENNFTFAIYNIALTDKTELKIYNAIGELVKTISVNNETFSTNLPLLSGIYFCNLVQDGTIVTTEKLIIL